MHTLVAATRNQGKIREIKSLLPDFELLSLDDIGFLEETPEPYDTFEENAHTKARAVYNFCGKDVFSEDSGLCLPALQGTPGVHSAYYGGLPRSDAKNNEKLLNDLIGIEDRSAYYKAIVCLIWKGEVHYFEGRCYGKIAEKPSGSNGFGYDPLFIPDGYTQSFGELPISEKQKLSHRGNAIRAMLDFLHKQV